jgi:hypothetical protein
LPTWVRLFQEGVDEPEKSEPGVIEDDEKVMANILKPIRNIDTPPEGKE